MLPRVSKYLFCNLDENSRALKSSVMAFVTVYRTLSGKKSNLSVDFEVNRKSHEGTEVAAAGLIEVS